MSGGTLRAAAPIRRNIPALDQINKTNVAKLEPVWTFKTGPGQRPHFNPVLANGNMYILRRSARAGRKRAGRARSGHRRGKVAQAV